MYSEIVVLSHKTGNRSRTYTYQNGSLKTFPGQLVRVPFGNNSFFGIIVSHSTKTNIPFTKPIIEVYGNIPVITKDQITFFSSLAHHYYGYLSDVLKLALPAIPVRQLQQLKRPLSTNLSKTELIIVPSESQIPKIVAGLGTEISKNSLRTKSNHNRHSFHHLTSYKKSFKNHHLLRGRYCLSRGKSAILQYR